MKIAFFDFETTGKETATDRVTQIAVALYDTETKRMLGCYSNTLFSEEYPDVHPGAAQVTGITTDYLKRVGELPYESYLILMSYLGKADRIIGHNIKKFDIPILKAEMARMHLPIEEVKFLIDTRTDLDYPEHITTRKLSYLAVEHSIPVIHAHVAIFDVIINAELFFKYDIGKTLELADAKDIWIRADVGFHLRQKAKDKRYMYDGVKKIWVKQIKEINYDNECKSSDFQIHKLEESYSYPET